MGYQHILLVTDLLSDADIVAQRAKRVLAAREAKLSVTSLRRYGAPVMSWYPSSLSAKQMAALAEARAKLAQFLDRNELNAVNSEVTAAISNDQGIVNYCNNKNVDLLIIGRHERRGIAAWLVGATADNILPNAPCDSLVVKLDGQ